VFLANSSLFQAKVGSRSHDRNLMFYECVRLIVLAVAVPIHKSDELLFDKTIIGQH